MKKRTRRVLALIILVSITSGLEPLQKLLFAGPCLVALMIEWDFVVIEEANRECQSALNGLHTYR